MEPRKFDSANIAVAMYHAQFTLVMLCVDFYKSVFAAYANAAKEISTEWRRPR